MPKVVIDEDEFFPVYFLYEGMKDATIVIPTAKLKWIKSVTEEWKKVQEYLADKYNDAETQKEK